jgi:hypothetical protein
MTMKRLKLDLDALRIESFHTDPADERGGAVHGYLSAWSEGSVCPGTTTTGTRPPF